MAASNNSLNSASFIDTDIPEMGSLQDRKDTTYGILHKDTVGLQGKPLG